MFLPRDYYIQASNKWCSTWDRIFHPYKNCFPPHYDPYYGDSTFHQLNDPPSSQPESTTDSEKSSSTDSEMYWIIIAVIIGTFVLVGILSVLFHFVKKRGQRRRNRPRRRRPRTPSLISRLKTWRRERRRPDGTLNRALSRARSIAKPSSVNIPLRNRSSNSRSPDPQYRVIHAFNGESPNGVSLALHELVAVVYEGNNGWYLVKKSNGVQGWAPEAYLTQESFAPPPYPPTPEGSPIADSFIRRGQEERGEGAVRTPPPIYQQRTGGR